MFEDQDEKNISCPYCGERISVLVDLSVPHQNYIEDCSVCCRPMELQIWVEDGECYIEAQSDSE